MLELRAVLTQIERDAIRSVLRLFLWVGGGGLFVRSRKTFWHGTVLTTDHTADPCPDGVTRTSIWVLPVTVPENIKVSVRCEATEQLEGHLTSYKLNSCEDQGWTNLETVLRSQESTDLSSDWDYFEDY